MVVVLVIYKFDCMAKPFQTISRSVVLKFNSCFNQLRLIGIIVKGKKIKIKIKTLKKNC